MHGVDARRRVARGIALAFLGGEWRGAAMAYRAADALAAGGLWLRQLVVDVRVAFPLPPRDALERLTAFVEAHAAFDDVWSRGWLDPVVRHWYTPPAEMGRTPWPVPALPTLGALAAWLGVSAGQLDWLADRKGLERTVTRPRLLRYRYRWVAKRTGGVRLLEAPKGRLRTLQRRILDGILAAIPPHEAAHGFRAGRSPLTHAALHTGRAVVVRADLRAFFADVPPPRALGLFRSAGYPEEVARTLVGLVTNRVPATVLAGARPTVAAEVEPLFHLRRRLAEPHLPQGAPTSPALANLCAFALDARLAALARTIEATYSRYADDLTFSGGDALAAAVPRLLRLIAAIVADEGFALNPRKTRVMRARARQQVTGIVVNRLPNVPRSSYDALKATLTNCLRHGPSTQARGAPRFREQLRGQIAWVAQVHPARGQRLLAMFHALDWTA